LLAAALAALPAFPLPAQPARQDLRVSWEGGRAVVSLAYSDPRAGEVLAALEEGLAAEIQFQLRLYRQRRPLAFLGDRLVAELRLLRTARYDRFERRYRILSPGAPEARFEEPQAFLRAFFSLGPLPLGGPLAGRGAAYYVQSRARLAPVKLVPPLKLITLFFPQAASPWLRVELPR
jgi:hypothetical protein